MKYSFQRELIREDVENRQDHPTAEMVYDSVKKINPRISLGTVYRNLHLLVDLGQIRNLSINDGSERFDCRMDAHMHFVCIQCKAIYDVDYYDMDNLKKYVEEQVSGKVTSKTLCFYGTCKDCLEVLESEKQ